MCFGIVYLSALLIAAVTNSYGKNHQNVYESVNGKPGPDDWPNQYPGCKGQAQSPIDILTSGAIYSPILTRFDFEKLSPGSKFVVENNGHSIQVNTEGNFYIRLGGLPNKYSTVQFHFHWGDNDRKGSEHTINGVSYPLEMHIVNWNSDKYESVADSLEHSDGLAVLGVLFEISANDNPVLDPIIWAIQQVRDPDWDRRVELPAVPIKTLLPRNCHRYYRYHGSLTTPGCQESVIWTIFDKRLTISERQMDVFRHSLLPSDHDHANQKQVREVLVNNYRPVQPLGGRRVYKSFGARR